jgi:cell division protein FtsB
LSQVTSTFWDDRVERVAASVKTNTKVKKRTRTRRLTDAVLIAIVLAAAGICFSVYSRARGELDAVLIKHEAAGEKVTDLTIRVQKLEQDVQQLRTDPRVIEQFARQRFGFVRSGEVVIKVAQDSSMESVVPVVRPVRAATPVRVANLTARASDGYTDASN